jgi:hypothetical protein
MSRQGRDIYRAICEAANLDAAVSLLSRDDLAEVAEYLSDLSPAGGVPSQVWGMVSARLAGRKTRRPAKHSHPAT